MGPKFELGDRLRAGDLVGEVVTVTDVPQSRGPDVPREYLYGLRLEPWVRVEKAYLSKDGEEIVKVFYQRPGTTDRANRRDHESDTLGCVPESALSPE